MVKHKNYRHNVNYYKNHAKGLPSVNALFSLGAPSSGVSSLGRTLSKNYCINICYWLSIQIERLIFFQKLDGKRKYEKNKQAKNQVRDELWWRRPSTSWLFSR